MTDANPGIDFRGVSKRFRRTPRADSLRDLLPALSRALLRGRSRGTDDEYFWALRDVSFSVGAGEVLGIIGPNGAGKSTVLRLLTGLLRPDGGTVQVRGRIGALIELASGFHPDLSGRENVFLQGAIMGLSRAEIRRRFDEIVAFAEVEELLDTPVKHYSSGMNARLGFAIAAHCDADILVVDEVLAVGDRAFQARAYARLEDEVRRGIPVVVVSHQLDRVATLCQRALLLSHGAVAFEGGARECIGTYIEGGHLEAHESYGACPVTLTALSIVGSASGPRSGAAAAGEGAAARGAAVAAGAPDCWSPGDRLTLRLSGEVRGPGAPSPTLGVRLWGLPSEERLGSVHAAAPTIALPDAGPFSLEVSLVLNLGPGIYRLQSAAWHPATGAEWSHGPSQFIEVRAGAGSSGRFWLDPRFRRTEA